MSSETGLVGIIPIVSDPVSLPSAVSGAYRLWETYSIDRVLIISTSEGEANLAQLGWWLDRLGVQVEGVERVGLSLEDLGRGLGPGAPWTSWRAY
ncbi:MAG: hypothetical protein GSR84_00870 [Desulfurococcales archaeon]|nr:hypothetical protein [Desulfurococcales archaeon]